MSLLEGGGADLGFPKMYIGGSKVEQRARESGLGTLPALLC